jgi:hypothetical protein
VGGPQAPRLQRAYGFSIPDGYCFHPGHTWVLKDGGENAQLLFKTQGALRQIVAGTLLLFRQFDKGFIGPVQSSVVALT